MCGCKLELLDLAASEALARTCFDESSSAQPKVTCPKSRMPPKSMPAARCPSASGCGIETLVVTAREMLVPPCFDTFSSAPAMLVHTKDSLLLNCRPRARKRARHDRFRQDLHDVGLRAPSEVPFRERLQA